MHRAWEPGPDSMSCWWIRRTTRQSSLISRILTGRIGKATERQLKGNGKATSPTGEMGPRAPDTSIPHGRVRASLFLVPPRVDRYIRVLRSRLWNFKCNFYSQSCSRLCDTYFDVLVNTHPGTSWTQTSVMIRSLLCLFT